MSSDFPFDDLLTTPFNLYFECIGLKQNINEVGFPNLTFNLFKKVFVEIVGWFGVQLGKLYQFSKEIIDALPNPNEIKIVVNKYIIEPFNEFTEFITNTKQWLLNKISSYANEIINTIPEINIDLGFKLTLPANQKYINEYNKLTNQAKAQLKAVVNLIINTITPTFNIIKNKVDIFIQIINDILTLSIDKITSSLNRLAQEFLKLTNPIFDLVDTFIENIIKWFNKTSKQVVEIKSKLINKILTLNTNLDDLPKELKII